jgi:hypothetical protein
MKKIYLLKKCFASILPLLFFNCFTHAQTNTFPTTGSAGIGTTTPNVSAALEMISTTKGLLISRMTGAQRTAIASPATGLMIYQTNGTSGFYYFDGAAWKPVTPKAKGWLLTGNAGTNPATDFIGTTDLQPLVFKVNNQKAGYLATSSTGNTAFGYQSLNANTSGVSNTAIGLQALYANTTGVNNTANGYLALYSNTTGYSNTAIGYQAIYANTTGVANTANGFQALVANTSGINNTANGFRTLIANTTGWFNTANGAQALYSNTTGSNNTAMGFSALSSNTTGNSNTATGYYSLYANTTGDYSTAHGYYALYANTTGVNNTAYGCQSLSSNTIGGGNTANGFRALYSNTTGYFNTANGQRALYSNTEGNGNIAIGDEALYSNTTGNSNTAVGNEALRSNTTPNENTAIGYVALYNNTIGDKNTAGGSSALYSNTKGAENTATGYAALHANTAGIENTAIGVQALYLNTTGNYNTALGYYAGFSADGLNNAMALGYMTDVNASNKVVVGNSSVTVIGGQVGWSTFSDGRFKTNIKENVPGLVFINKLKPVTYNLEIKKFDKFLGKKDSLINSRQADYAVAEKKVHTGFVAQDVEKAAQELKYDFDGINHPQNGKDNYALVYADFVPSLVKAVQELSAKNDDLQKQINDLKALIVSSNQINPATTNYKPQTTNLSFASLEQNIPNPFNQGTVIKYYIPAGFHSAQLIVTDLNGKSLKRFDIKTPGYGAQTIAANELASGLYQYSLIIDGKAIDSRKMELLQ